MFNYAFSEKILFFLNSNPSIHISDSSLTRKTDRWKGCSCESSNVKVKKAPWKTQRQKMIDRKTAKGTEVGMIGYEYDELIRLMLLISQWDIINMKPLLFYALHRLFFVYLFMFVYCVVVLPNFVCCINVVDGFIMVYFSYCLAKLIFILFTAIAIKFWLDLKIFEFIKWLCQK